MGFKEVLVPSGKTGVPLRVTRQLPWCPRQRKLRRTGRPLTGWTSTEHQEQRSRPGPSVNSRCQAPDPRTCRPCCGVGVHSPQPGSAGPQRRPVTHPARDVLGDRLGPCPGDLATSWVTLGFGRPSPLSFPPPLPWVTVGLAASGPAGLPCKT